jgi:penicillin-binding protein-related factor A (putative recombinase)
MARPVDLKSLKPELRERVINGVKVGPNSPLVAHEKAKARRAQHAAGDSLEDELSIVHQLYELRGRATIERAHPATFVERKDKRGPILRYAKGGAAVDFYGTANVGGKSRSIYFDAKSCSAATYAHEPRQYHQLQELVKRQRFGALAFLLIADRTLGAAYIVLGEDTLLQLLRGRELTLRKPIYHGEGTGRREKGDRLNHRYLYPHFFTPEGLMQHEDVPRWDWLSRLETLAKEGK